MLLKREWARWAAALGKLGDAVLKRVKRLGLEDDDALKFSLSSSKLDKDG